METCVSSESSELAETASQAGGDCVPHDLSQTLAVSYTATGCMMASDWSLQLSEVSVHISVKLASIF